ncbi:MAG: L-2-amino-thiazoline-4-carboxylic acid hydrolase [Candidatus Thorarchaeota archaeon]
MEDDGIHKFDEDIQGISYRQYLRDAYAGRITLIRELEAILGQKRTHEIIEKFYTQNTIDSVKKLVDGLDTSLESIEDFRDLMMKLKEAPFAKQCQTDEFIESEPGTVRFCTKECLYADVFRGMDAADLGLIILCNGDISSAEVFHPKLRLERTKTLMQGDDCCDFKYMWDD